jgi:hypothetical protein
VCKPAFSHTEILVAAIRIRSELKLSVSDVLEWKVEDGKAIVLPVRRRFLEYRNAVKVGKGDIAEDIDRLIHEFDMDIRGF